MATVPTPLDWVANTGVFVTAALLQAGVRDPLAFLADQPRCQAYQNTPQSITTATNTSLTWDTEDYDNDGMHSLVSNTSRFTAVTAGRYVVSAQAAFTANATGIREIRILKNGTTTPNGGRATQPANSAAITTTVQISNYLIPMIVGDYIEIQVNQTSGAALSMVATNGLYSYLHMYRVCA